MIGRRYRFHGLGSLNVVYRHGQTIRSQQFAVRYVPAKRPTSRVAIVVSRKISKSAVVRNRIRRRVYALVQLQLATLPVPLDIVITVFSDQLAVVDAHSLERSIKEVFRKLSHQTTQQQA
jgi:ribonuclease P protein component